MAFSSNLTINTLFAISIIILFTTCIMSKRLCGRELADTLKTICKNNYNGFGRLTSPSQDGYNAQIEDRSLYEYQSVPFISKLTGTVLSTKLRRRRHGVSDECCKKACTYKELSSYCNGP